MKGEQNRGQWMVHKVYINRIGLNYESTHTKKRNKKNKSVNHREGSPKKKTERRGIKCGNVQELITKGREFFGLDG